MSTSASFVGCMQLLDLLDQAADLHLKVTVTFDGEPEISLGPVAAELMTFADGTITGHSLADAAARATEKLQACAERQDPGLPSKAADSVYAAERLTEIFQQAQNANVRFTFTASYSSLGHAEYQVQVGDQSVREVGRFTDAVFALGIEVQQAAATAA